MKTLKSRKENEKLWWLKLKMKGFYHNVWRNSKNILQVDASIFYKKIDICDSSRWIMTNIILSVLVFPNIILSVLFFLNWPHIIAIKINDHYEVSYFKYQNFINYVWTF